MLKVNAIKEQIIKILGATKTSGSEKSLTVLPNLIFIYIVDLMETY